VLKGLRLHATLLAPVCGSGGKGEEWRGRDYTEGPGGSNLIVEGRVYEKNTNIYNVKDEKHVHGQF
jgi:hypothetical protein